MPRIVIAGNDAYLRYSQLRDVQVSKTKNRLGSEALPKAQIMLSQIGFIEAEIVASVYGYSLRYASGIYNWGIIYSNRNGHSDEQLEHVRKQAVEWVNQSLQNRFVTFYVA